MGRSILPKSTVYLALVFCLLLAAALASDLAKGWASPWLAVSSVLVSGALVVGYLYYLSLTDWLKPTQPGSKSLPGKVQAT